MSSSVCQGLQSCQEPRFVESRFFRPKSAPSISAAKPCFAPPSDSAAANDCKFVGGADLGGWSFLQSLANTKAKDSNDDQVYVHPLVKRSASMLSEKSLEMCTESLGSETGSDVSDDMSLLLLETASKTAESVAESRKTSLSSDFPPPLTSITGSHGVQVRSHREDGRLLLEAVRIPRRQSYFHAQRSDGRLRLSLFKDATPISDHDADDEECNYEEEEQKNNEHGQVLYEEDEESYSEEDMEGDIGIVGGEMGTGKKLPRLSSCKQSGRGHKVLLNCETFWVAT